MPLTRHFEVLVLNVWAKTRIFLNKARCDEINPRAYKRESMPPPPFPIGLFLNFSKNNYYLDLPFSVALRISLRHILTQVRWESVTRYDVISSRCSSHFLKKNGWVFFTLFRWKTHKGQQKATKCLIMSYLTWNHALPPYYYCGGRRAWYICLSKLM